MSTLYYSNDQLGRFISWVKSETLGSHTIVAVTGDHNIRGIGYPEPQELALGHAVPFSVCVPLNYQHSSYFDGNRVGSHKDILPTLYQLSLSDTLYYTHGVQLVGSAFGWYLV
ncbi:sulfatase-like hydrolase/transferase [Enterobacter cloacae complex sp. 301C7]|uniref:sulfatase-like hydrolase/transferase n=1 Tax=Enterobacter cloacae complex sp. 301C7 TaxID=3395848 RepID=UPI003CFB971C